MTTLFRPEKMSTGTSQLAVVPTGSQGKSLEFKGKLSSLRKLAFLLRLFSFKLSSSIMYNGGKFLIWDMGYNIIIIFN